MPSFDIKEKKGTTPSTEGREILESGAIHFLKAENINNGEITNKPLCFIDEETHNILKRSQLKANEILFVIAGQPKNEQSEILDWLGSQFAALNSSIDSARYEIDLLREYRTRLISDVVTGMLDMRGVKLHTIDEAEALKDIDTGEDTELDAEELIETEEVANADE